MNITLNATLQLLGFSIVTLLATGALVLGGLNELNPASDSPVFVSHIDKEPR
ncbi:hypothetical protein [Variovorax boronicumulans]|uniref:hypothetical protein n=1 Tax=Variovorax boronicumulans TaxID=436515 RepID=UPI003398739E